jgi:AcrR family transcriptional regulator
LREALLEAALRLVQEQGASVLSLREVARHAGVSHAAPAHHFGDKAGLLTALATEGFVRFKAALVEGSARGGADPNLRFGYQGWAYVMFAAQHRAHFELMFRPELLRKDDPELARASGEAYAVLLDGIRATLAPPVSDDQLAVLATSAWSQAHGLATLWLSGNLAHYASLSDLDALARKVFGLPPRSR